MEGRKLHEKIGEESIERNGKKIQIKKKINDRGEKRSRAKERRNVWKERNGYEWKEEERK